MLKRRFFILMSFIALAINAIAQTDYEKYIDAAKNGDAKAQYEIALCYREGKGVKKSISKTVEWLKKAADQDNADAQGLLGQYYLNGYGVKTDVTLALELLNKSVEKGSAVGQFYLGNLYFMGKVNKKGEPIVSRNEEMSIQLLQKAAEQRYPNAGVLSGNHYLNKKDWDKAIYYYLKEPDMYGNAAPVNLGMAYEAKGDYKQAVHWYQIGCKNKYNGPNQIAQYSKRRLNDLLTKIQQDNIVSNYNSPSQTSQTEKQDGVSPVIQETPPQNKKPSSPVDLNIPTTDIDNSNTFAIVIGNEKYKNVADVPFAVNDAKVFSDYLEKTLGVPREQIKLLENAGYNDIRIAVNWLNQAMEVCEGKGKAIVYYAGHGIPNETDNSSYLLPVDGIGNDPSSAYSLKDLYDKLSKMQAQTVTVFLDACFSGTKRDDGMLVAARGVAIKVKQSAPKGKMVVFSAAQGDETAYPYQDMQHGLFTYHLLKKLQETKGDVTLGELGDYLKSEVKKQSFLKNNKVQTPMISVATALQNQWESIKLK